MVNRNLVNGNFGIKLVWPGWFEDSLADKRVGFPPLYDQRYNIPISSKMLIYVTDYQRIMAINKVMGTWEDGKVKYEPSGSFPLCLPIECTLRANYGLGIKEIQRIIPRFRPHQGLSFFHYLKENITH